MEIFYIDKVKRAVFRAYIFEFITHFQFISSNAKLVLIHYLSSEFMLFTFLFSWMFYQITENNNSDQ